MTQSTDTTAEVERWRMPSGRIAKINLSDPPEAVQGARELLAMNGAVLAEPDIITIEQLAASTPELVVDVKAKLMSQVNAEDELPPVSEEFDAFVYRPDAASGFDHEWVVNCDLQYDGMDQEDALELVHALTKAAGQCRILNSSAAYAIGPHVRAEHVITPTVLVLALDDEMRIIPVNRSIPSDRVSEFEGTTFHPLGVFGFLGIDPESGWVIVAEVTA